MNIMILSSHPDPPAFLLLSPEILIEGQHQPPSESQGRLSMRVFDGRVRLDHVNRCSSASRERQRCHHPPTGQFNFPPPHPPLLSCMTQIASALFMGGKRLRDPETAEEEEVERYKMVNRDKKQKSRRKKRNR
jgi:hypothetical protein